MFNPTARSLLVSSLRAKPNARNPFNCQPSRTVVTVKDIKHTAVATATGPGRKGRVSSTKIKLKLSVPKELGACAFFTGAGGRGQNPEQLFAMAHAASFLGAIQAAARPLGKEELDKAKKVKVHAKVHIGPPEDLEGYAIAVDIKVEGAAKGLLKVAHKLCAYTRALEHGAEVKVSLA